MLNLQERLSQVDPAHARELLYYLARYFKQANFLEEGGKDTFDDVFDRTPNEAVKVETMHIASEIEGSIGKKASEFDDDLVVSILDSITQVDDALSERMSDEDLQRATSIIGTLGGKTRAAS